MIKEKMEELTALMNVEATLNDLIKLISEDGERPCVDVIHDAQGFPRIHVYLTNNLNGGSDGEET